MSSVFFVTIIAAILQCWFKVQGSSSKLQSSRFKVQGSKFKVQGSKIYL